MSTMSYAGHPSSASLDFLVFDVYRSYIEEHVNLLKVAELMPCMKEVLSDMRKVDNSARAAQIFLNFFKRYNVVEKYKELAEALLETEYEVLYCALDCGPVCFASAEHKKVMSLFSRRVEETFSPSVVAEQLECRGVLAIENFRAVKLLEEEGNIVDAIFLLFDSLPRQNKNWYEHLLEMAEFCEYTKLLNKLEPTYYLRKKKSAAFYQEKARPETLKVFFAQDDRHVYMKSNGTNSASLDFLVFDVYRSYIEEHVNLLKVAELMPCMKEVLSDMRKVDNSARAAQIFLNFFKRYNEVEKYKELAEALLQTEYEVLYCALDCGPVFFGSPEHKKVMSLFSRRVEKTFSPSKVAEQLASRGVLAIENFQAIKYLEENGNFVDAIFLLFDSLARQNEKWYEHLLEMADLCEYTKLVNELDPTYYDRKGKSAASYQEKARPETSKVFFAQDDRLVNMKSILDVGSVSEAKMQASTMSGWKTPKYGPTTPDIRPNSALSTSRKGTSYMGMEPTVQMNAVYMDQQVLSNDQGMDGRNTGTTDSRATTMYAEQVIDGRSESRAGMRMDVSNTGAPVSRGATTYAEQCVDGRRTGAPASHVALKYPDQRVKVRNTGGAVSRVASTYPEQCVDGWSTGAAFSRVASTYPDHDMDLRTTGGAVRCVAYMFPDQVEDCRSSAPASSGPPLTYPEQGMDNKTSTAARSCSPPQYQVSRISNEQACDNNANLPFSEQVIDSSCIRSECRSVGIYTDSIKYYKRLLQKLVPRLLTVWCPLRPKND